MPYKIVKGGGRRPWKIVKLTTGKVVGTSRSKKAAVASIGARYRGER